MRRHIRCGRPAVQPTGDRLEGPNVDQTANPMWLASSAARASRRTTQLANQVNAYLTDPCCPTDSDMGNRQEQSASRMYCKAVCVHNAGMTALA